MIHILYYECSKTLYRDKNLGIKGVKRVFGYGFGGRVVGFGVGFMGFMGFGGKNGVKLAV